MSHIRDHVTDDLAADIVAISLHDGSPGDNGANEITGGGYARLAPSYAASSAGDADLDAALEFDGPANQQVTHYGLWIAGPTFLHGVSIAGAPVQFNSDGRLDLTSAPISTALG